MKKMVALRGKLTPKQIAMIPKLEEKQWKKIEDKAMKSQREKSYLHRGLRPSK